MWKERKEKKKSHESKMLVKNKMHRAEIKVWPTVEEENVFSMMFSTADNAAIA